MNRGTKPMERSGRLKPRSKRRARVSVIYSRFRELYLGEHYQCEFEYGETAKHCRARATDIHHIRSRGRSGRDEDLVDPENVLALCRRHHDWIETHRADALRMGYLKKAARDEERWA